MSGGLGTDTSSRREPLRATSAPDPLAADRAAAERSSAAVMSDLREGVGMRTNLWRDQLFRRALFIADVSAFALTVVIVSLLFGRALQVTWVGVLSLLSLCFAAKIFGLYDHDRSVLRKSTLDEAPKLFQVATLGALCTWLAGGFVIAGETLSRTEALLFWALLLVLLLLGRATARAVALHMAPAERCLFIGDHASAKTLRSKLSGHHGVKAEMVAHLDPTEVASWSANAVHGPRLTEIHELASSLDVERAIVGPDSVEPEKMLDLVCTLKAVGIKVSVLPRLLEVVGSSVEFDDLHGVTLMGVKGFALTRSSIRVKRVFDFVGAVVGLLAVAPLMLAFAVAIKLDSRGPVFFRQRRVGRHGEYFELFKFRTMVADADLLKESLRDLNEAQEGLFKIAKDPRVTRVGKLLRKTSLDELPQLFNIVRGEMSLVGPRPLVLDEDEHVTGWYRRRLELMPGMTGPWQILGPARVPLREMGAIDYLYVANWSLWGDVKIMVRTVPHMLARRGL